MWCNSSLAACEWQRPTVAKGFPGVSGRGGGRGSASILELTSGDRELFDAILLHPPNGSRTRSHVNFRQGYLSIGMAPVRCDVSKQCVIISPRKPRCLGIGHGCLSFCSGRVEMEIWHFVTNISSTLLVSLVYRNYVLRYKVSVGNWIKVSLASWITVLSILFGFWQSVYYSQFFSDNLSQYHLWYSLLKSYLWQE